MTFRKFAVVFVGFILLLAVADTGYVFGNAKMLPKLEPPKVFADSKVSPVPDYSKAKNWSALPDRKDAGDHVPAVDSADNQKTALADVFYVHPTTYLYGNKWNQPMGDKIIDAITDGTCMTQATPFNKSCKVYAPRYRQGHIKSFEEMDGNGGKALALAYSDVKVAFQYYLDNYNKGRPFIIAAHSQGSEHAKRLLEDFITGKPLKKKMIAAYLIGREITREDIKAFPDIPICNGPTDLGCLISWNTQGPDPKISLVTEKTSVCVNPLTWTNGDAYADKSLNLGGVRYAKKASDPLLVDKGICDSQCVDGALKVNLPKTKGYDLMPLGKDNYHIYDFSLFYMNIRQNAVRRVAAYLNMK